jgi:recombination protein RecA
MSAPKSVGQALKYLQAKHGDSFAFSVGDESPQEFGVNYKAYPFSSHALNDILGIGGIPSGRIVQIAGAESSGKTLLSLDLIKNVQQADPNAWAVFVDAEYTFDKQWAESHGVDTDRLVVIRENDGDEIWTALCGDSKSKDKPGLLRQVLEDEKFAGLKLVVLDSIASISPPVEMAMSFGDQNYSPLARFLPHALRKLTPLLSRTGVSFVGINQVRVKPGVMYGNPEQEPGGHALKHACSVMIHVAKINKSETAIHDDNGVQIGHRLRVRIDKNKCAPAYKVAELDIGYLQGIINTDYELVDLAIQYGAIKQRGPMFDYNGENFKGRDKLFEYFKGRNNYAAELLTLIKEAKVNHEEQKLSDMSLENLKSKADNLGINIPEDDLNDKDAIIAHINALS